MIFIIDSQIAVSLVPQWPCVAYILLTPLLCQPHVTNEMMLRMKHFLHGGDCSNRWEKVFFTGALMIRYRLGVFSELFQLR